MTDITITADFDEEEFERVYMCSHKMDMRTLDANTLEGVALSPRQWRLYYDFDYIMAQVDGRPCGYAIAHPNVEDYLIKKLWTHPDYRKRGIGGRLIKKLFELARNHGSERVLGECHPDNIEFFKNRGFKVANKSSGRYHSFEKAL